ncbi:MAG: metallophosphoesterase [Bryobacterales bacterium]|nr:metallophosphoesterase [Bryobacterales bacterium]
MDLSVVTPLLEAIHAARPSLTVISGDFVQNGWRSEFEQARAFVQRLPQPWLAVPGNHDLPFVNAFRRIITGLRLYQEYITTDLEPFWTDNEIAVMGITTARRLQFRGGRIAPEQIRRVQRRLCSVDPRLTRVLVSHHPFDLHESYHRRELVGRARLAMGQFAQSVDILLAGHMHISHAGHTAVRYKLQGRSAIFVQAGTATSTRGRGEPNAFNRIVIAHPNLVVERHQYRDGAFHCVCLDRVLLERPGVCETRPEPMHPKDVQVRYPQ